MLQRMSSYLSDNKYPFMMLILLTGASIFSHAVWRLRLAYSGTSHYSFLTWNLFLAWIPFLISYFIYTIRLSRRQVTFVIPIAAFFWLLFFPNAPYLLTDFQHLAGQWREVPVWFDVMMLNWFAFTGVLLGMVSLFLMQEIVRREFGYWTGWGFVAIVAALSSVGIYVGRFLQWNSWDIFFDPKGMAQVTIQTMQNPGLQSISFMTLFTVFFLFLYITLYTFGHLLLERRSTGAAH